MRLNAAVCRPWAAVCLGVGLLASAPSVARANTVAVSAGHTLVVTDAGVVYAFGDNSHGQAGQPAEMARVAAPSLVPGLSEITAVAAGAEHSLALDSHGRVWAFGGNGSKQLGLEGVDSTSTPTLVPGLTDVVAIAAGDFHSVALTRSGSLFAWGLAAEGQLDNGSTEDRATPTLVRGLSGVVAIAAGGSHTLAVLGPLDRARSSVRGQR